jgi:hypothetical protein
MSKHRGLLGLLVLGLFAGSWVVAADKDTTKAKGTLPAKWSKLGLSDEQKEKIYTSQAKYRAQIDELRAQIRKLQKQELGELEAVLTDAQKARLREILVEKAPGGAPPKEDKKPEKKPSPDKQP